MYDPPSHGGLQVVNMLLAKGMDLSARDSSGVTLLHEAALVADCPIIRVLLDAGVDMDIRTNNGRTPLFETVSANHTWLGDAAIAAAKLLLVGGADVHAKAENGRTVLHEAVLNKKPGQYEVDIVKLLLNWGIDVHARDEDGDTALDLAAMMGDTEVVGLLRDAMSLIWCPKYEDSTERC